MCVRAMLAEGLSGLSRMSIKTAERLLFRQFNPAVHSAGIRHIVVYRIGNIGDTVVAVPALAQIRQAFPQARITLLTSAGHTDLPGAGEVLSVFPGLADRIVSYYPSMLKQPGGLQRLDEEIRQTGPVDLFVDLPVSMQTWRRNAQELFLARALDSRFAIGFAQIFPPIFKHAWSREFPQKIPQTSTWLCDILNRVGLPTLQHWPVAHPPELSPILRKTGIAAKIPLLLVNAGGKLAIKQWPADYFVETLRQLLQEIPDLQIGLLGGANEHTLNRTIAEALGTSRVMTLAGQLTLAETFALMTRARAVLSNDTGTMHMAGILNIPIITPMGGQFPAPLWHPPLETSVFTALRHATPCTPCFRETCRYAETHCLTGITGNAVADAVRAAIR